MLLAIDPGLNTGWALFNLDTTYLISCGICEPDLRTLYGFFDKYIITKVVVEVPQVYRRHLSKGDPNCLVPLAIQAGDIRGMAYCAGGDGGLNAKDINLVSPGSWKGGVPKAICAIDVEELLHPLERALLGNKPKNDRARCDDWDAVGLGLYELNRLGIRKGWSRSR